MSEARIYTTHTGSLPRPQELAAKVYARRARQPVGDADFERLVAASVVEVVQRQAEAGIDVVSDGEYGKPSFMEYVRARLDGFDDVTETTWSFADVEEAPGVAARLFGGETKPGGKDGPRLGMPNCVGEVRYVGQQELQRDIRCMRDAVEEVGPVGAFLPAVSPGCIADCTPNRFYRDYETYLGAIAEAMKEEYRTIVEAGFLLQLDCPDITMSGGMRPWHNEVEEKGIRRFVEMQLDALDAAVGDLPRESLRMHLCWGNYPGPHHHDLDVGEVLDLVVKAHPQALVFEAANPRHEHEWVVYRDTPLPEDIVLIPGVIDTKTNVVEHPELVAQRLERYAQIVGIDRVIGGTDCGFGTSADAAFVDPAVAWMKLEQLAEGARLATDRMARRLAGGRSA